MKQSTKPHEASTDPLIGQTLGGKYSIVRLIGRGGVGLVYLARQADPPRDVVVKVLAPHWADDPEALKRFDREAKRLRGLNHPNIVEMLGFGHDGDRAYLVMEYLQGELLSDHVARKRRLTLEEFVPIAAQILKGIGHAHSRELMVRDVKPANVMLCERKGRANFVKILDFGLAKLLRGEQAITEEHVMGTVGYLAPEAIKGEPIDLRVDVYAIGVLFYYMLAGRLPFEGESNAAVFYKTINEQPKDLADLLGLSHGLPRGLVDLVHACLEKDRDKRPADADRIVEKLIDVVPASLFRLPRAATERHGVPISLAPGVGNTGLMELLSVDHSPSHELPLEPGTATPPPGTLRPISSPLPAAVHETGRSALLNLDQLEGSRRTMSLVAISVVAGALAAILVAGALLVMLRGDDEKEIAAAGTTAAASPTKGELSSALDEIDARIGRGDLDGAAAALDRVRSEAKDDRAAFARVELAEKHIRVARLSADAAARETEGDTAAAIVAYRDILALDPKHAPARAALARLEAVPAEPTPPPTPSSPGVVDISSRPTANLYIDGSAAGTTPYHGKLKPGRHKVKLTARGYHNWEGTIDVGEAGTLPLAVTMRGKGSGKGGTDPEPATAPDPVPSTSPTPPPADPVATPPVIPTRPPEKKDPFLPTKPSTKPGSRDDPFLPVKKP